MKSEDYLKLAKTRLSKERYEHTCQVARLAKELALNYGLDGDKAYLAGVLHDMTKEVDKSEQLQTIKNSGIITDDNLSLIPNVYHSITGMLFAKNELHIEDEDVLNAILYHTTGRSNMTMFEKIIFTADTTSYERHYDGVEELRKLAFTDINKVMLEIFEFTFEKLIKRRLVIAKDTFYCYNWLAKEEIIKGK